MNLLPMNKVDLAPRPINLQDELLLQNRLLWQNVDSIIVSRCYDKADNYMETTIEVKELIEALLMTTIFVLLDDPHQQLALHLLPNYLKQFCDKQHLEVFIIDDGARIKIKW